MNDNEKKEGESKPEVEQIAQAGEKPQDSSVKKKHSKRVLVGIGIGAIAIVLACAFILPNLFPSVASLIDQGKYEEAYEVANNEEKEKVAIGNAIACCAANATSSLKSSQSLELVDAYYDGKINFILHVSIRLGNGVKTTAYLFYKYMYDGSLSLFNLVQNINEEETYSDSASESEKVEVAVNNATKAIVRGIVEDPSNQVGDMYVEAVNKLMEDGELSSVELIPQAREIIELNKNSQ